MKGNFKPLKIRTKNMNIGQASQATSLPAKTIRYYEDIGLVQPTRQENGYRDYSVADIDRLQFIQKSRFLGFTIKDCRQLLSLYEDKSRNSAEVKALAQDHLREIETKLEELQNLHTMLKKLTDECHGDDLPDCPILDGLAKPQAITDTE